MTPKLLLVATILLVTSPALASSSEVVRCLFTERDFIEVKIATPNGGTGPLADIGRWVPAGRGRVFVVLRRGVAVTKTVLEPRSAGLLRYSSPTVSIVLRTHEISGGGLGFVGIRSSFIGSDSGNRQLDGKCIIGR